MAVAPKTTEEPKVTLNDIGQRTVDSTTTLLTAPNGVLATVHLGWIVTLAPQNDEGEEILMDEDGIIGEDDLALLASGAYVLESGCEDRGFYHVEADPTAVRGYATSSAANMLVEYANSKPLLEPLGKDTGEGAGATPMNLTNTKEGPPKPQSGTAKPADLPSKS